MKVISFIVVFLLITGCTKQVFTDEERKQLSDVMLTELVVSEKAYQNPDAANWTRRYGSGMLTGAGYGNLTLHLLSIAFHSALIYLERDAYDEVAQEFYASIEANMPGIALLTERKIKKAFESNPFFASRIRESSSNQIKVRLLRYGFVTTSNLFKNSNVEVVGSDTANKRKKEEEERKKLLEHEMQFLVAVRISISSADDKIAEKYIYGISESKAPLATYINSPENIEKVARESISQVHESLTAFLEEKTTEN